MAWKIWRAFVRHLTTFPSRKPTRWRRSSFQPMLELLDRRDLLSGNPTSTGLLISSSNLQDGQLLTLTATVSGDGGTPTGNVTFEADGVPLAEALLTPAMMTNAPQATYSISTLPVGNHGLMAIYEGDSTFESSSSLASTVTVSQVPTATFLSSSANPAQFGQAVTFTASVSPQISGTPTGTVTFSISGVPLATVSLTPGPTGAQASYTAASLDTGNQVLEAVYDGDSTFAGSTAMPITELVSAAMTNPSLASSLNPVQGDQSVTSTATSGTSSGTSLSTGLDTTSSSSTSIVPSATVIDTGDSTMIVGGGDGQDSGESVNFASPVPGVTGSPSLADPSSDGGAEADGGILQPAAITPAAPSAADASIGIVTITGTDAQQGDSASQTSTWDSSPGIVLSQGSPDSQVNALGDQVSNGSSPPVLPAPKTPPNCSGGAVGWPVAWMPDADGEMPLFHPHLPLATPPMPYAGDTMTAWAGVPGGFRPQTLTGTAGVMTGPGSMPDADGNVSLFHPGAATLLPSGGLVGGADGGPIWWIVGTPTFSTSYSPPENVSTTPGATLGTPIPVPQTPLNNPGPLLQYGGFVYHPELFGPGYNWQPPSPSPYSPGQFTSPLPGTVTPGASAISFQWPSGQVELNGLFFPRPLGSPPGRLPLGFGIGVQVPLPGQSSMPPAHP